MKARPSRRQWRDIADTLRAFGPVPSVIEAVFGATLSPISPTKAELTARTRVLAKLGTKLADHVRAGHESPLRWTRDEHSWIADLPDPHGSVIVKPLRSSDFGSAASGKRVIWLIAYAGRLNTTGPATTFVGAKRKAARLSHEFWK